MKNSKLLYKRRLALFLAAVLTLGSVLPVGADTLSGNTASENAAGEEVITEEAKAEGTPDDIISGCSVSEEQAGGTNVDPVSGDTVSTPSVSSDDAISADAAISADTALSEDAAGDTVSDASVSADVTVMYYFVGSNLERDDAHATRDMVEIMTGIKWAMDTHEKTASVNIIAETGGVSFKQEPDSSKTEEQHRKTNKRAHEWLVDALYKESANDLAIYNAISAQNIKWDENQRWELSSDKLIKAKNDKDIDANRTRVMTAVASEGKSPELIDFITTTVRNYPAKQYMLVLWDHGGGPRGGFGGDDRGTRENSYITASQLSKSLSEAREKIKNMTDLDNAYKLDKFAFIGFDACLMGNLETAMALKPYADYMFGSEDLEAGTGWDHREYVKELYTAGNDEYMGEGSEHMPYDEKYIKDMTCRIIGKQVADDNMDYYKNSNATFSVVSLNELEKSEDDLDTALKGLADLLINELTKGSQGAFIKKAYISLNEAAEGAVKFNSPKDGILDLYSFCEKVKEGNFSVEISVSAQAVMDILKPDPDQYRGYYTGGTLVPIERYTRSYHFSKDSKNGGYPKYDAIGGMTIFFPFKNERFYYTDEGTGQTRIADGMKKYTEIYDPAIILDHDKLSEGYRSLLKCFAGYQSIGRMIAENSKDTPAVLSAKMKEEAKKIVAEYGVSRDQIIDAFNSMCEENGEVIRGKLSANNLVMKTVVSDGTLKAAFEVIPDQRSMVKKLRREPSFTESNGTEHKLGFVPETEAPVSLKTTDGADVERFVFNNFEKNRWFFIGDNPASVFSIRNDTEGGSQDFYDPFDIDTPVTVYLPVAKRDTSDDDKSCVVLMAEFGEASENAVIKGYYQFDPKTRQLATFTPWTGSEDFSDIEYRPLSDMGEFAEGAESNFNSRDITNDYGSKWVPETEINKVITRTKPLSGNNIKFNFTIEDIFGGTYLLDNMSGGERVTSSIRLSSNEKPGQNVMVIEEGQKGIVPEITFHTSSYYLTLDHLPEIGFKGPDGKFIRIKGPEDIAALKAGTYPLVFEEYDAETGLIDIDTDYLQVSVDGIAGSVDPKRYVFVPDEGNPVLTVINKKEGLSIKRKEDIPYGILKTLVPSEDMRDYVSVFNGDKDITFSSKLVFTVSGSNGKSYNLSDDKDFEEFSKLPYKPGDVLSVDAILRDNDDKVILWTESSAHINVLKQDVRIVATYTHETFEHELDMLYWNEKDKDVPDIHVILLDDGREVPGRRIEGGFLTGDSETIKLTGIISSDKVRSVYIERTGLDKPGSYTDVPFGPDDGHERASVFENEDFKAEFSDYYNVADAKDAVVEKVIINPDSFVRFISMTDGSKLAAGRYVSNLKKTDESGRYTVSDSEVFVKGAPVKEWYIRIGDKSMVPVYLNGSAVGWTEDGIGKILVEKQSNEAWSFYLPKSASSNKVWFYAGYEEKVSEFTVKSKDNPYGITVRVVEPVEYTGRKLVTTTSGKTGSKLIDLNVSASGNIKLKEGVDYTVSYKNNKNAASLSSNKPPVMIISGKGKTYKGFKAEVKFTILPADLSVAEISAAKRYAPFTAKKLNVSTTVKLPGGVKLPSNVRKFEYYDEFGNELKKEDYKRLYNGSSAALVKIIARSVIPSGRNPVINYIPGSVTEPVFVTGYPKGGKKLTVKLKKSSVEFKAPVSIDEVLSGNFKTLKGKNFKTGKTEQISEDMIDVLAYYDKNLIEETGREGKELDRVGTYYLSVELKNEYKADFRMFYPTVVKYKLTGKKIAKGKTKLVSTNLIFAGTGNDLPVTVQIDKTKCPAEEFYITVSTRDGGEDHFTAGYDKAEDYDFIIGEDGVFIMNGIDNGAVGKYKITLTARKKHTGKISLSYTVK